MSDGPHRSLNMRPGWKKVAESADIAAFTTEDVRERLEAAMLRDWRSDISPQLLAGIRRILSPDQPELFDADKEVRLETLRQNAADNVLGQQLIDCAVAHVQAKSELPNTIQEVVTDTLIHWAERHIRQTEEHYLRMSSTERAFSVRNRFESGVARSDFGNLSLRLVNDAGRNSFDAVPKKDGLDEGVPLG